MALTKSLQIPTMGSIVTVPNAYIVVSSIEGGKEGIAVDVSYYTDKTKTERLPLGGRSLTSFIPSLNDSNFFEQSYEHLKTLEQFSDCIDC